MKLQLLPSIATLAVILAGNGLALTPVLETFDGTTLDKARWYEYRLYKGGFKVADGKLNFVTAKGPTKDDYASVELLTTQPGYNESWEIIVDLSNTAKGRQAACGIMLANTTDRQDYLFIEFYGKEGIAAGIILNGKHADNRRLSTDVGLEQGSLRITFNKATKIMTFHGSLTAPGKPYKWNRIGTFSPAGQDITGNAKAKKRHVKADWKMNPASGTFAVQLFGFGEKIRVKSGKATLDNVSVSSLP